mmetsp:Transcript_70302/g.197115  ORF Transcript_70302/g.197115 Transcript_70302/m.197115 type:complete len:201 (+) Transcript_70302:438-1040(+)
MVFAVALSNVGCIVFFLVFQQFFKHGVPFFIVLRQYTWEDLGWHRGTGFSSLRVDTVRTRVGCRIDYKCPIVQLRDLTNSRYLAHPSGALLWNLVGGGIEIRGLQIVASKHSITTRSVVRLRFLALLVGTGTGIGSIMIIHARVVRNFSGSRIDRRCNSFIVDWVVNRSRIHPVDFGNIFISAHAAVMLLRCCGTRYIRK